VGRRAVAELHTGVAASALRVVNDKQRYGFDFHDKGLRWRDDPGHQGELFEAAIRVFNDQGMDVESLAPFSLQICSQDFFAADAVRKLGLGSSAAVSVALSGCLQHALNGSADCETALAVHREFQHHNGSGIDVRASYYGGTLGIHNGAVNELVLPKEMHLVPVWTGVAASTLVMLRKLAAFAADQPERHAELLSELSAHATVAVRACEHADASALQAALSDFAVALHALDNATELGIWSVEHRELERLASAAGLVYKPSGAGGGDFGLAFGTDAEAAQAFRASATETGFSCADFEWGVNGLTMQ
jgi:phosphomevalonate kinase